MKDYLVKALAFNDSVRIYCVSTTNALNEIGNRLNYLPSALDAMGRLMSVTVMMGAMLKLEETVTVKIEGDSITFEVLGYGHGVGMSQTGADSMAKLGNNYETIIKHYYTGVEIQNVS